MRYRMFERFAEAGGTLIDTAETYQHGESETLLGDFLAADPEPVRGRDEVFGAPALGVPHDVAAEVRERYVGADFDLAPVPVA